MKKILFIAVFISVFLQTKAQVILDMKDYLTIPLKDGTDVTLFGASKTNFTSTNSKVYYYLPCNLRLNKRDGNPTFLLQSYLDNNEKVNGAILGAEFIWGLTKEQLDELNVLLKSKYKNAVCKGPAYVRTPNESGTSRIGVVSATVNQTSVASTPIATTAGEPSYLAANLSYEMAQVFDNVMRNNKTTVGDLTAFMGFTYYAKMTGVTGTITVDWEKLYKKIQQDSGRNTQVIKRGIFNDKQIGNNKFVSGSYIDELVEKKIVQINIENNQAFTGPLEGFNIEEAFLQIFQSMISQPVEDALNNTPKLSRDTLVQSTIDRTSGQMIYVSKIEEYAKKKKNETITINYSQTIPLTHYITANIKQWYNSQIKSCKGCTPEPIRISTVKDLSKEGSVGIGSVISDLIESKVVDQVTVSVKSPALQVAKTFAFNKDSKLPQKYQFAYLKKGDDKITYGLQIKLRGSSTFPSTPKLLIKDELTPLFDISDIGLTKYDVNITNPNISELLSQNVYMVLLQLRFKQFGIYKELSIPVILNEESPMFFNKEVLVDLSENSNSVAYRLTYFRKGGSPILATDFAVMNSVVEINIPPALLNNNEAEMISMEEKYKKDPGTASESAKAVPAKAISELEKLLKE